MNNKYNISEKELKAPNLIDYIPAALSGLGVGSIIGSGAYFGLANNIDPDLLLSSGAAGGVIGANIGIDSIKNDYQLKKDLYLNKLAQEKMNALERAEIERQNFYQPNEYDLDYYIPKTQEEKEELLNQLNQLKLKTKNGSNAGLNTGIEIVQKIKKDSK